MVLGATPLACASGDYYEEGRETFCDGLCEGFQRCGLTDSGCASRCLDAYHPRGIRGSSLGAVGDCLRDANCDALGDETASDACFDQVAKSERLRPELVSYCESASLNDFRCNIFWSVEECSDHMGLWEDAVLERAQACHQNDCSTLQSCEKAVFDAP